MKSDPDEELTSVDKGKAFSTQLLTCIMSLANHLHEEESPGSIFFDFCSYIVSVVDWFLYLFLILHLLNLNLTPSVMNRTIRTNIQYTQSI